ncbi:MAG: transferrin-binding protein-like solute binding protein [Nitrospira sp. SB0662_bin_26]|nr:transferrin-binding protein-like solute binding protein [Nitrospira sp. SB0662_bin_26]
MRLVTLMALFLLSLTVGCSLGSAGSLPDIPIPDLTPVPQPFRAQTSWVDGVFSVTIPTEDGRTRTLDTIRDFEWTYGRFLPRPVQPNHSSREWVLVDNHYDGRVALYAVVDWDNADPTDYLAAGWWLAYPPGVPVWRVEAATRGVFLDGPELDPANPPDLPLTGTATYVGGMGGLYTYQYGRSWGELADSSEIAEFQGLISLTADFDQNRLTGCMGCLRPIGIASNAHLHAALPRRNPDPTALPADYDLHFEASFGANGAFEDTAVTVMHPDRTITTSAGTWQGQFSNVPDVDGNPRRVVGSTDVHFAEDDGSQGRFTGIFDALTPATITPPDGNGGPMQ